MKVLFIAHYREKSGYGQAARDYILAMDSVGIDVVCRPVLLGQPTVELHPRILELESRPSSGCDYCIQFLLPHNMDYNGNFKKCVALFDYECWNYQDSTWPYKLEAFDEVWTPSKYSARAFVQTCRAESPTVKVIPHATDVKKYEQTYEKLSLGQNDNFIFYTIGEAVVRKNLSAIIKAFHIEFSVNEPVSLVIKTSKFGLNPNECKQHTVNFINMIKHRLKLYPHIEQYKEELVITERFSDEKICQLHHSGDCFVLASRGEAFSLPTLDAIGFGKTVVAPDYLDYHKRDSFTGYIVNGQMTNVDSMTDDTFNDLYTGHEQWFDVSVPDLAKQMRRAYEDREPRQPNTVVQDYSYESIGNKILASLNG